MHGLKSAILAIFQKSADWLDWPCPVSPAFQNGSRDLFSCLYKTIVGSSTSSFDNSDSDPSSVSCYLIVFRGTVLYQESKLLLQTVSCDDFLPRTHAHSHTRFSAARRSHARVRFLKILIALAHARPK